MLRTCLALLLASSCLCASAAYKCTDEKGKVHYEDVPPAACANVVIYEVGASGNVVRRIEPGQPPNPPAPRDAGKKAEGDRAALDRERRDRTLLDTFSTEKEIDTARDRSVELIRARMESVQRQLELVRKRRKPKDPATAEEATLEHSVAGYQAELERVQQQFETDKSRWRELRQHARH